MAMLGLRHLALFIPSERFEATTRFYRSGLGMAVDWQPDDDNVYLSSGGDNLALHRAASRQFAQGQGALDHLGFVVSSADDVTQVYEALSPRASELEIELVTEVKTHRDGATSFYLKDPAGNRVQVLHIPSLVP